VVKMWGLTVPLILRLQLAGPPYTYRKRDSLNFSIHFCLAEISCIIVGVPKNLVIKCGTVYTSLLAVSCL